MSALAVGADAVLLVIMNTGAAIEFSFFHTN